GLEAVREARAAGANVLAETCPQYLFLTADRLEGPPDEAAGFVCVPPLRADADREALWRALGSGELQAVSTDHCPFTRADRRRGTRTGAGRWSAFTEIPGGLPGVETRLSLVFQGVRDGRLTPERWVELTSTAPARLFGLADRKGSISPGMDADLVVFDPAATKRLDARSLHMRTDHSPYADLTVTGWPAATISRGRVVALGGEPAAGLGGRGRFMARTASGPSGGLADRHLERLTPPGAGHAAPEPQVPGIEAGPGRGWSGSTSGGSGGCEKSNSFMRSPSAGASSRTVGRESGRPSVAGSSRRPPRNRSSTNFRYASNDSVWWSIVPGFAHALISRPGTRIP